MEVSYTDINIFWFSDRVKPLWFRSTPAFDNKIREQFEKTWIEAKDGAFPHWQQSVDGLLALVILFDQFPLNMFRGEAKSFSTEANARECAAIAIKNHWDLTLDNPQRSFLYLPYMHSEYLEDQEISIKLFSAPGFENNLRWARHHRDLIKRFGRFPHRNQTLGRDSTDEEIAYLNSKEAFHG